MTSGFKFDARVDALGQSEQEGVAGCLQSVVALARASLTAVSCFRAFWAITLA